jgi:hypothetical protein
MGSTQPREYNWGATWKKSSGSVLEIREYGRRNPLRWPRGTLYPQKVGNHFAYKRRTQAMEFSLVYTGRTEQKHKEVPATIAGTRAEIRTRNLPNTRQTVSQSTAILAFVSCWDSLYVEFCFSMTPSLYCIALPA